MSSPQMSCSPTRLHLNPEKMNAVGTAAKHHHSLLPPRQPPLHPRQPPLHPRQHPLPPRRLCSAGRRAAKKGSCGAKNLASVSTPVRSQLCVPSVSRICSWTSHQNQNSNKQRFTTSTLQHMTVATCGDPPICLHPPHPPLQSLHMPNAKCRPALGRWSSAERREVDVTIQKIRRFFRANTRIKTISSQMKKGADVIHFADLVYLKYKTLLFGCSAARRA